MSEKEKHSPLPWKAIPWKGIVEIWTVAEARIAILEAYTERDHLPDEKDWISKEQMEVNAEFIERACNSYDSLVVALEETTAALGVCCLTLSERAVTSVESIIAKAQATLKPTKEGK